MSDYKQETKNRYKGYIQIIGILLLCMVVLCLIVPSANAVSIDEIKHQSVVYSPITQYNNYTNTTMNNINDSYMPRIDGNLLIGSSTSGGKLYLNGSSSNNGNIILNEKGGRVAVGNNNPLTTLDVNGDFQTNGTSYLSGGYIFSRAQDGLLNIFELQGNASTIQMRTWNAYAPANGVTTGILFTGGSGVSNMGSIAAVWNSSSSTLGAYLRLNSRVTGVGPIEVMRISENGSVGIKITSPTKELHVSGNARISGLGAGTVMSDANGNLYTVSDEKTKTNIQEYKPMSALSKINSITPKTFNWKKDSGLSTSETNLGFIAGELKYIIPEAVTTKQDFKVVPILKTKGNASEDNIYEYTEILQNSYTDTISDRAIIAVQVLAIQELNAKNIDLQNQINKLNERLDRAGVKS